MTKENHFIPNINNEAALNDAGAETMFPDTIDPRFLNSMNRESGSVKLGVAFIAAVGLAGIMAFSNLQDRLGCVRTPTECLPNPDPIPEAPIFGEFHKEGEQLIGTASVLVSGKGQILVSANGKLDYNLRPWDWDGIPLPGDKVEGTMFLKATPENPATLYFEPCNQLSEDYTKPLANYADDAESPAPTTDQENTFQLTVFRDVDPATGKVTGYRAVSGAIEPCHMRFPTGELDESAVGENIFYSTGEMGQGHEKTLRAQARYLLTEYAEAASCPETIVDVEAVKNQLRTIATGIIVQKDPNAFVGLTPEQTNALVLVEIEDAVRSQNKRIKNFEAAQKIVSVVTETLPDSKKRTFKIKPAEFGKFEVVSCLPIADLTIEKKDN